MILLPLHPCFRVQVKHTGKQQQIIYSNNQVVSVAYDYIRTVILNPGRTNLRILNPVSGPVIHHIA